MMRMRELMERTVILVWMNRKKRLYFSKIR
jgi:hypothetical protein